MPVKKYMKRKNSEKEAITQRKISIMTSQSSLIISQKLTKASRLTSEETKCKSCEKTKQSICKQSSNCSKNNLNIKSSKRTVNYDVSADDTYNQILNSVPASCAMTPDDVSTWGLPWNENHVLMMHDRQKFPYIETCSQLELRKLKVPSDNTACFIRFFTLTGSLRKDIPSKVESREKENSQVSIVNLDHFCEGLRAIEKHVTDNFYPHNKLQPSMKMNYENIRELSKRQLKKMRRRQKQFNRIVTSQNKQLLNSPYRLQTVTSQLPTYPKWRKIPRFERVDDVTMMRGDLSFYLKPLDICLSFHRTDSLLKLCDKFRLMRAKIWDNFKNESKPGNDSQVLSFVQMLADNFEQNHEMNQFDLDSMLSDTYKKGRYTWMIFGCEKLQNSLNALIYYGRNCFNFFTKTHQIVNADIHLLIRRSCISIAIFEFITKDYASCYTNLLYMSGNFPISEKNIWKKLTPKEIECVDLLASTVKLVHDKDMDMYHYTIFKLVLFFSHCKSGNEEEFSEISRMKRCCDDVTKLVKDALKLEAKLLGAKKQHDLFDHYMKVLENCRRLKDLFDDIDPLRIYVVLKIFVRLTHNNFKFVPSILPLEVTHKLMANRNKTRTASSSSSSPSSNDSSQRENPTNENVSPNRPPNYKRPRFTT